MSKGWNHNIDLVVFLFVSFYAPPIIPRINLAWLATAYAIVKFFISKKRIGAYIKQSGASVLLRGFVTYCTVWILTLIINVVLGGDRYWDNYITSAYSLVLFIPATSIIALFFSSECIDRQLGIADVLKIVIVAGLIESILAIAAFVVPSIREEFVSIMRQNTGDAIYSNWVTVEWRFYGFAISMLDLFGVGSGVIAGLPLYLSLIPGNRKWAIATPVLFVVPLLNSRTGILLFGIMLCGFLVLLLMRNAANILSIPLLAILVALFVVIAFAMVNTLAPATANWITMDATSFFESGDTVTGKQLFSPAFWELPEGPLVLTGTGHTKYALSGFSHSDVGYVNQIWRAGIIGSVIMYGTLAYLIYRSMKSARSMQFEASQCVSGFLVAVYICLIVGQIKCDCFVYTAAAVVLFAVCFFINLSSRIQSVDKSFDENSLGDFDWHRRRRGYARSTIN